MMEYGSQLLFVMEFQFLEETGEYPLNEKGNCDDCVRNHQILTKSRVTLLREICDPLV
jgi:hypothetical protein